MASVITYSTSLLPDADDKAMGVYVHSLRSNDEAAPAPIAASDPAMVAGGHIYADECRPRIIPSLKGSPVVVAKDPVTIVRVIQHGGQSVDAPNGSSAEMPAYASILGPQEIADVATYVRNSWGNAAAAVTADNVNNEAASP